MLQSSRPTRDTEQLIDAIALPAFLLSVEANGALRFRKLNRAHVAAVGIQSDEVEGKTPHECLPARVADTILRNYRTCQNEEKPHSYEEVLDLRNGERWWETTLSPLHDNDGTLIGILGIASDITERKRKEFKAVKAHSDLQKINDNITLFSSMTAHDVRGPLHKINALTEMTLEGFEDMGDDKRQTIEMTQQVAEQALEHVEGILGYARALSFEADADAETSFDVSHLCRDIAALVDPEAKLNFIKPEGFIECESVVLQMILRNLVENASRHAKDRIVISFDADAGRDGFLRFSVTDDGGGFPGGAAGFESNRTTRGREQGTRGFGLASVAHLVETRHGKLWLDETSSAPGAAICFTLPGRISAEGSNALAPQERIALAR